jgi:hypothetical protein
MEQLVDAHPDRVTEALDLPAGGGSVVDIVRTAYTHAGRAIDVNDMTLDVSP